MRTQSIAYPLPATLAERRYERKRQNDIVSGDAIGMIGRMGERIRAARKAEGLNQVQLAKKAGIAQSTLSALERGENRGIRELMALANALRRRPQCPRPGRYFFSSIS